VRSVTPLQAVNASKLKPAAAAISRERLWRSTSMKGGWNDMIGRL
jgi:hypothetical protein